MLRADLINREPLGTEKSNVLFLAMYIWLQFQALLRTQRYYNGVVFVSYREKLRRTLERCRF